jgi:predicted nucleotidyltransferase
MTRPLNPNDPNVVMLELVARRLGPDLCDRFAFVGGAVAGLLITDPANPPIRPTEDVDIVAAVLALSGYHRIEKTLRERGFTQDISADAPICRWKVEGVTVDVMPTLETILGFANRWYPLCVSTAESVKLPSGVAIRVIQAPVFIGTKLEAFHGRGRGDYLFSHDLGDIISVVDGRDSLVKDCERMPQELKDYLARQFSGLLADRRFRDALPGHLPGDAISQSRLPDLQAKIQQLAHLAAV